MHRVRERARQSNQDIEDYSGVRLINRRIEREAHADRIYIGLIRNKKKKNMCVTFRNNSISKMQNEQIKIITKYKKICELSKLQIILEMSR